MKLLLMDLWVSTRYAWTQSMMQAKRNMSMMFYAAPYVLAIMAYFVIAPLMTFLAGLVLQLIIAALLADYMDYIEQITLYNMNDKKEHKRNFKTYFRTAFVLIMLVYFINYAFDFLLAPLLMNLLPFLLVIPFIFILYGALFMTPYFESLFIGREEIGSAFSEVGRFMKKNAWVWVINALVLLMAIFIVNSGVGKLLYFMPLPSTVKPIFTILIFGAIYQFFFGFAMLYRANLYDILNKGSRQSRVMRLLNKKEN